MVDKERMQVVKDYPIPKTERDIRSWDGKLLSEIYTKLLLQIMQLVIQYQSSTTAIKNM